MGLPETSVKEAKERVRSALLNSHFSMPEHRITVNLAPADLPKQGGRFDVAIAIGILLASQQLAFSDVDQYEFYGELALSGEIRAVNGILPILMSATEQQKHCVIPIGNQNEAQLVANANYVVAASLHSLCLMLNGQRALEFSSSISKPASFYDYDIDLIEVKGQSQAKRALEIAAAGGHHLLFLGPPGTGKSMLAQRMATILPELTEREALQTATVYSIIGKDIDGQQWRKRPFRSPHHTCSAVALVGGSSTPKPGEISLAHNGVLFLDELTEFERKVIDSLREPLETQKVTISRAAQQCEFPANFQLVCALNPSPTGCDNDGRSSPDQILKYLNKVSGPFIDRIDMQVELPRLTTAELQSQATGESSQQVRERVCRARNMQWQRQAKLNSDLANRDIQQYCVLNQECLSFLAKVTDKLALSPRGYHRTIKVARTIADLSEREQIALADLKEAVAYRAFERLINRLTRF